MDKAPDLNIAAYKKPHPVSLVAALTKRAAGSATRERENAPYMDTTAQRFPLDCCSGAALTFKDTITHIWPDLFNRHQ